MTAGGDGDRERGAPRDDGQGEQRPPSTAERITLGGGVALILGLVALVTYLSFFSGNGPPLIEATPLEAEVRGEDGPYHLPIAISNRGGQTAQEVLVLVELDTGTGSPEVAEVSVDFLAGGETVERTAVFSADPAEGRLTVDVASFR